MLQLADLQASLTAALLTGDDEPVRGEIVEDGMAPSDRLDVYRNNIRTTIAEALAQVYPVIQRLVGEGYFQQVARAFVRERPPRAGSLVDYGGDFPGFLSSQPSAAAHPYLGDVARLEWACHQAFHAADVAPPNLARLRGLPAEAWARARICMSPSVQLIRSDYPVARIWREHQPDRAEPCRIELGAARSYTSVARLSADVEVRDLGVAEFLLVQALEAEACLEDAFEVATQAGGPLDLGGFLREWLAAGLIVNVEPMEGGRA